MIFYRKKVIPSLQVPLNPSLKLVVYKVCNFISVIQCPDPGGAANATHTLTGVTPGSTVSYICDSGYKYEAGYLVRTCQSDGKWDGVPPVCSGIL